MTYATIELILAEDEAVIIFLFFFIFQFLIFEPTIYSNVSEKAHLFSKSK